MTIEELMALNDEQLRAMVLLAGGLITPYSEQVVSITHRSGNAGMTTLSDTDGLKIAFVRFLLRCEGRRDEALQLFREELNRSP